METIEYRWREEDRVQWGAGPWDNEPDKRQWQDEETGLPCLIVRGPRGALCGYVGISEGHPLFEKTYSDRIKVPDRNAVPVGENPSYIVLFLEAMHEDDGSVRLDALLDVHGGITFGSHCSGEERGICHKVAEGENDHVWWLGFDCAHHRDLIPGDVKEWREGSYRDWNYVTSQVRGLAKQLKDLSPCS